MTDTTASPVSAADVALVCEGGGARNSFTAATVHEFMACGVRFGWIGGVSAGASHTVNYLGHGLDRTRESFVEFTASPASGGVGSFIRGDGYFDAEYIYETSDCRAAICRTTSTPSPTRPLPDRGDECVDRRVRAVGQEDITDRERLQAGPCVLDPAGDHEHPGGRRIPMSTVHSAARVGFQSMPPRMTA